MTLKDRFASVVAADYDEDAELQADIWNSFIRKTPDQTYTGLESTSRMTVTPFQIMDHSGSATRLQTSLNKQDE